MTPQSTRPPALHAFVRPNAEHTQRCLLSAVAVSLTFAIVYVGTDYLTGLRTPRFRMDFAFEQHIPFVPQLSPVYSSLYLMFAAMPFVLHTTIQLRSYTYRIVLLTLVAGVAFLLLPAELAFPNSSADIVLPWSYLIADQINLTYNLCPSLHVAYAAFHASVFQARIRLGGWTHVWATAIAVSAWLTHQHHVIDLFVGYATGVFVAKYKSPIYLSPATTPGG